MILAVMSGKGGVGKSSIAMMLGIVMSEEKRTLILDFDVCGPSVATGLNIKGEVYKADKGLVPIQITGNLYALSMGCLIRETSSVVWRGPKKISMLSMFYDSIDKFECVIIDMPPGISEEHAFLIDKNISVLIVTTPQNISLDDSSKAINFCLTNKIPVLGLVENMSGYYCDHCENVTNIFGSDGGMMLAADFRIPFMCKIEIEPYFGELLDSGELTKHYKTLGIYSKFKKMVSSISNVS